MLFFLIKNSIIIHTVTEIIHKQWCYKLVQGPLTCYVDPELLRKYGHSYPTSPHSTSSVPFNHRHYPFQHTHISFPAITVRRQINSLPCHHLLPISYSRHALQFSIEVQSLQHARSLRSQSTNLKPSIPYYNRRSCAYYHIVTNTMHGPVLCLYSCNY